MRIGNIVPSQSSVLGGPATETLSCVFLGLFALSYPPLPLFHLPTLLWQPCSLAPGGMGWERGGCRKGAALSCEPGSKGIGVFSKIQGGIVGNLLSQFPFEGQVPRFCAEVLWGGRRVGWVVSFNWFMEGPVSPANCSAPLWGGRETCTRVCKLLSSCCLCLFPVIPSCPICLVCSFLECVSVCLSICLSVFLMTVSLLLWEETMWMFSDSVYVSVGLSIRGLLGEFHPEIPFLPSDS